MDGTRVYFAGDTDFIPEMKSIQCDVALLPVSGTYVMTVEEAVQAAAAINPKIAVPMHYGTIVGSSADATRFQSLVKNCRVEII
jgi:L-ascorbate metabolism protein UlaG (beta-lactamase superfamily)